MSRIYGGHIVARYLKESQDVSTVFSLIGGHIDRIHDGLIEYGIRAVDVRHEQSAAMMAHAWSIYTNSPGLCLITAGPGFTNALTGIANAYMENAPVVVICGTAPLRDMKKGALQEMNQADMVKPIVKWHGICLDIRRIPEYLALAFRNATTGRPGPVFLELPPDILNIQVDEADIITPGETRPGLKSAPAPEEVQKAAELINNSERPLILGGSGVHFSGCSKKLREFIESSGIPFSLLNNAKGSVPDDHPLSIAGGGQYGLMNALSKATLVIALGIRFNWLLMFGQVFPGASLVHADIDPTEIDRNRTSDAGLVGDIGLCLEMLFPLVKTSVAPEWTKSLQEESSLLIADELESRKTRSHPVHPARMVELVRQAAGKEAFYIVDGGDTSYFGLMGLPAVHPCAVIASAGGLFGCLGTGIPFAIAAKTAHPRSTVIVINGDGSFGFNAMEFETAIRHDIPFVCVINNDQAWGMIKHGQEINYGCERLACSEFGVVHYEKMVEALGGYGEFVENEADIPGAVKRAVESGKAACINVLTDPSITSPATLLFTETLKME